MPERVMMLRGIVSIFLIGLAAARAGSVSSLFVDYSAKVDPYVLAASETAVIHPEAETSLGMAKAAGTVVLAYLSVVEVAADADYRERLKKSKIPFLGRNNLWNSDLVDVSHSGWSRFLGELGDAAMEKGFDGFFLDTPDSVELLMASHPAKAEALKAGLVETVRELRRRHPNVPIVINRGFAIYDEVKDSVTGVLAESVFQTYDFAKKAYGPVAKADSAWVIGHLEKAKADGKQIYVVDYVGPADAALAEETAGRIAALGFVPFVTTPDLGGRMLAPLRPVERRIAVLFGRDRRLDPGGSRFWPLDTWVARFAQMPLEWMGYDLDYFDILNGPLPELGGQYVAVLFDGDLDLGDELQRAALPWLRGVMGRGLKVVFLGRIPFSPPVSRDVFRMLGIVANDSDTNTAYRPIGVRTADSPVNKGETEVRPIPFNYFLLRAGGEAEVFQSVEFQHPASAKPVRFDTVFRAPWGGAALFPTVFRERPDYVALLTIDMFAFLERVIGPFPGPAPDVTTRDGLRVWFNHVDADGFSNRSEVTKGKYSSEVIRDEIFKKYPVPVTSSIIESEIRGHLKDQPKEQPEELQAIARDIFAMPNVQVSSHTYSHPFFWMADDRTASIYEEQMLILDDPFNFGKIDPKVEVQGSIEYINRELVPEGKKADLLLWSGNCRAGPEAVDQCDLIGVENMNGGDTIISRRRPSMTAVAPLLTTWDGRLQVFAAAQNEMLFTGGFKGPRWGGFVNVIQTFERTELPRRLKPVNIYYHMFIADRDESLNSLRTVYDWAMGQPLQSTTAVEYARSVRQWRSARIFRAGEGRWVVVHGPDQRTFRLPEDGCVPDLAASRNVTGWNRHAGSVYVSTTSSPRAVIATSEAPAPHLFLESASAPPRWSLFGADRVGFSVSDFRPVRVVLGGVRAGVRCDVEVNGSRSELVADDRGRVELDLPTEAVVSVAVKP